MMTFMNLHKKILLLTRFGGFFIGEREYSMKSKESAGQSGCGILDVTRQQREA